MKKQLLLLMLTVHVACSMEPADEIHPAYKKTVLADDNGSLDTTYSFNPDFSNGWLDILLISPQEAKEFKEKKERKEHLRKALTAYIDQDKGLITPLEEDEGEYEGETVLGLAATHKSFSCIIDHALKKGANPNLKSPLQVALRERCLENARVLIAGGAQVKDRGYLHFICNPFNDLPHYNATYLRVSLLRILLQAGVDPNEVDNVQEETALYKLTWKFHAHAWADVRELEGNEHKTFLFERKKLITTLLDAKLNPNLEDSYQQTALESINNPGMESLKEEALVDFLKDEIKKRGLQS